MSDFQNRLSSILKLKNISRKELCESTEIGETMLSNYETGYCSPPLEALQKIAAKLEVSLDYLMGTTENPTIREPYRVREIPILRELGKSKRVFSKEDILSTFCVSVPDGSQDEYFGIYMEDDSMNAGRIEKGDLVIIKRQNFVSNGEIVAVCIDGKPAIIRKFFQSGSIITLMPNSRNSIWQVEVFDTNDCDITIAGKVFRVIVDF